MQVTGSLTCFIQLTDAQVGTHLDHSLKEVTLKCERFAP
jgi:hypothetical protein